ncbi:MAG: VOC family protein [Christensenellaceae bacterium]|nr:VOC family protein [Christensenellaceae bacterium]
MSKLGAVAFGHVGIYVRDIEVSKKFYMDILEFSPLYECLHEYSGNRLCFLKNKNCIVELVQFAVPKFRGDGLIDHLTIEVEDIKSAAAYLKSCGIELEGEIKLDPQLGENGMYYVMFRGPDDEHLQITQTF